MRRERFAQAAAALGLALGLCSCQAIRGGVTRQTIAAEYYAIAEAYADLEKYDKAIPYYENAAKEQDYRNAARYGLGRMYGLTNDWEKAADIFESLLKKERDNEMLRSAYAFALVSSGRGSEAVPLYRELMEARPDDPLVARNYVEVQILAKEYEAALKTIAATRESFPDSEVLKDLDDLEAEATAALAPPEEEEKPSEKGTAKEPGEVARKELGAGAKKTPKEAKKAPVAEKDEQSTANGGDKASDAEKKPETKQ